MVTWPPRGLPGLDAAFADVNARTARARVLAAHVLGGAPGAQRPQARSALQDLLARDADGEVRFAAALSLGHLGDVEALPDLFRAIDDADAQVRQAAVMSIAEIGAPSAVPRLLEASQDGNPDVRFQALAALVQLAPEQALSPAQRALADDDAEVRAQAAAALGALASDEVVPLLQRALADPDDRVRWAAAVALGDHGDAAGADTLLAALADDDRLIEAAEALGRLGDRRAIEPLQRRMKRILGSAILKVAAAGALQRLGDRSGKEFLLKTLAGGRWEAKGYAAELCADLGIVEARPLLERLRAAPGPLDPQEIEAALARL